MLRPLLLAFLLLVIAQLHSQKYALMGDTNKYVCQGDSLAALFERTNERYTTADTTAKFLYFFDNGRYESGLKAFFWMESGVLRAKAIYGCDAVQESPVVALPVDVVFEPYLRDSLYLEEQYLSSGWSHEFGYDFRLDTPNHYQQGYIRDSRRGADTYEEVSDSAKVANRRLADRTPLVKWINRIDDVLRQDSIRRPSMVEDMGPLEIAPIDSVASCDSLFARMNEQEGRIEIKGTQPTNLEESLDILEVEASEPLKAWVRCLPDGEFGVFVHHGFGTYLRNTWGLWGGSRLKKYMNRLGVYHPDDMSSIILDSFQRRIKGEDINLETQVSYYQEFWKNNEDE